MGLELQIALQLLLYCALKTTNSSFHPPRPCRLYILDTQYDTFCLSSPQMLCQGSVTFMILRQVMPFPRYLGSSCIAPSCPTQTPYGV